MKRTEKLFLPSESKLGVMGSGQLGRMFAQKAKERGYSVSCYSPEKNSPAFKAGCIEYVGDYTDKVSIREFLDNIDALTFEFENIPEAALSVIEEYVQNKNLRVCPSVNSIRISQNRFKEKENFRKIGLNTTDYIYLNSLESLYENKNTIEYPCILKTNQFGYDGKGQHKIKDFSDLEKIIKQSKSIDYIIEKIVDFSCEISIVAGRFDSGKILYYLPSENSHKNHILDISIHPASINHELTEAAIQAVKNLLSSLNYVGVLALEFFVKETQLICNEFAPRPHNSGHFSMDASNFSQFEMQLHTLTNLEPDMEEIKTNPCVMKNIIGFDFMDLKETSIERLKKSEYKLHLYQKEEPKKGRKMGHWNYLGKLEAKDAFPE